jgi:glycosyltransferase involved in cell wall biosynthesis
MLIGFEAKRFFKNYTGLGNYSRFIINALSEYYSENQYILYTPTDQPHPEVDVILKKKNIEVVAAPKYYPGFTRSIWRTWGVSNDSTLSKLDIFHGLSHELPIGLPKQIKKVVTVHDAIFLRYPQFYNHIDKWIYKSKLAYACNNADKIIAVSKQTAEDLIEFFKVDPAKIDVVYQGCHSNYKQRFTIEQLESIKKKHGLPKNYILNVGTIEPRKNLLLLIRALAEIPKNERLPVMIIGKETAYAAIVKEEANRLGVMDDITFLKNIPFADFPAIYQAAQVFVYPSLFEGFGIPLIEAIESGVPVITSTGSCFLEAAGPSALYVNPHQPLDMKEALLKVIADQGLRRKMIDEGHDYVKQFRPEIIAEKIMETYKSI